MTLNNGHSDTNPSPDYEPRFVGDEDMEGFICSCGELVAVAHQECIAIGGGFRSTRDGAE